MVHKWITLYKEKIDAKAWLKQWAPTAHTFEEQNQHCLLRGDLPAHNNNAEDRNNGDTIFLDHRKPLTAEFVHHLAVMMENRSNSDLKFCNHLHRLVHCCAFYKNVYSTILGLSDGVATPLTVTLDYRNAALGFPQGSLLIASLNRFFGAEGQLRWRRTAVRRQWRKEQHASFAAISGK